MTNQLIPVFTGQINSQSVQLSNARLLHTFLESKQDFSTWIKSRIKQYEFVENQDYLIHKFMEQLPSGAKQVIDYHITLDMAKELSMVERNAKGKQARQYFIDCEKQAKQQPSFPVPQTFAEALMLAAKLESEKQTALAQIEEDKPKVEFAMAVRRLDGSCLIEEFAKALGTGRNRLYRQLRDLHILRINNIPYQPYIDNEWFVLIENEPFTDSSGKTHPSFTTRIGLPAKDKSHWRRNCAR